MTDARHEQEPTITPLPDQLRRIAKDLERIDWPGGACGVNTIEEVADALTSLATAVKGCGKRTNTVGCGWHPCGSSFFLCRKCRIDRDAAIRTLLGKTE